MLKILVLKLLWDNLPLICTTSGISFIQQQFENTKYEKPVEGSIKYYLTLGFGKMSHRLCAFWNTLLNAFRNNIFGYRARKGFKRYFLSNSLDISKQFKHKFQKEKCHTGRGKKVSRSLKIFVMKIENVRNK